jgi:hypothetical protein
MKKAFEMAGNLAVRRIFGTELQEVTSVRRKLHTEELLYLFLHI